MRLTAGAEGLVTTVTSVLLYFIISDFPEEVRWLTQEEKAFVKQRLLDDVGDPGHDAKYGVRDVLGVFKDRKRYARVVTRVVLTLACVAKVIIGGFMYLGQLVPACKHGYILLSRLTPMTPPPIQMGMRTLPPPLSVRWVTVRSKPSYILFLPGLSHSARA